MLQTSRQVVESQEQGPGVVLGIGAELFAQTSLVRQARLMSKTPQRVKACLPRMRWAKAIAESQSL